MDMLWYGLKVALVGMLVVFAGLVILIGCIKALKAVGGEKQAEPAAPEAPAQTLPTQAPAAAAGTPRTYVPGPRLTRKDDTLFAVLTAAVAAVLEAEGVNPEGGFAIRSVKPVNEPQPGPAITPKDDAFYAVITAAVAKVLEEQGINPEGGFAIRSVKAL